MQYFETKERIENLEEFRGMYREYIDFTNRENNMPAQMLRKKMEPLAAMTVDSLQDVGLGRMVTREADSDGGRAIKINIIKAIFRDKILKRFALDDLAPLDALEEGLARYKSRLAQQRIQLLNPAFWLFHFIGFIASLPLLIIKQAGYDTRAAERLTSVRFALIIIQVLLWYLVLDLTGVIGYVRFVLGL